MSQRETSIYFGAEVERRASASNELGTVRFISPVFGVLSEDLGGWRELVAPWSITRTVGRSFQIAQYNHRSLIGSRRAGTMRSTVTTAGIESEVDLPDTTTGRDVAVLVDRGDLTGASFTFSIVQPSYWTSLGDIRTVGVAGQALAAELGDADSSGEADDDTIVRVLMEIAWYESGPVDMAAYPADVVSMKRSIAAGELAEQRGINRTELRHAMDERRLAELVRPAVDTGDSGLSVAMARELVRPRRLMSV